MTSIDVIRKQVAAKRLPGCKRVKGKRVKGTRVKGKGCEGVGDEGTRYEGKSRVHGY